MARKKTQKLTLVKLLALIFLIFYGYTHQEEVQTFIDSKKTDTASSSSSQKSDTKIIEFTQFNETLQKDIELLFCPKDNCFNLFKETLESAQREIKCAVYEFDDHNISEVLLERQKNGVEVKLVIDHNYIDEAPLNELKGTNIEIVSDENRGTRYDNYMHDKFCIIDDKIVIAGSMNPTENGFYYNNNNVFKIESEKLASTYEKEFDQLFTETFGYNKKSYGVTTFNFEFEDKDYELTPYFCPQDDCSKAAIDVLESAQSEILFANFVLTYDDIENILIQKSKNGLNIRGVIESRMFNSQGSRAQELKEIFPLQKDINSKTMHHKFFVVDGLWVITGSMNPSNSGVNYNDENLIIIKNEEIAQEFREEFFSLLGEG